MDQSQEDYTQIIKGKRTKRPRQALQEKHDLAMEFMSESNGKSVANFLALTTASSSSSMAADSAGSTGGVDKSGGSDRVSAAASSGEVMDGREDEDMANCLILLAQGQSQNSRTQKPLMETKAKLYVYQCNTCSRSFPSFQALGGHRASHKKPKPTGEEKKPLADDRFSHESTALSLQLPNQQVQVSPCKNVKTRVHDCSICGAEFSSGQALGGHMRRHRRMSIPSAGAGEAQQEVAVKKSRNILALDLNFPAPAEVDHGETKFPFASKEQIIVFSASSLVDCHY